MCVCVFPDCLGVTSIGLWHLSNLTKMHTLTLRKVPDSLIYGQAGQKDPLGWIQGVSGSLISLYIYGELLWHGHTVSEHGNTMDTNTLVMQLRQVYSCW